MLSEAKHLCTCPVYLELRRRERSRRDSAPGGRRILFFLGFRTPMESTGLRKSETPALSGRGFSVALSPLRFSIASTPPDGSPPCFFWKLCSGRAVLEKAGRSVCRRCAATLRGQEYPLRPPTRRPLYLRGRDAAEAMQMIESNHKRLNCSGRRGRFS